MKAILLQNGTRLNIARGYLSMLAVDNFLKRINHQPVIRILVSNEPVTVLIRNRKDACYLIFSKDKVESIKEYNGEIDCELSGEEEMIQSILDGKIQLQEAIKLRRVQIECTYRTMLLLESFFWLQRVEE